MFLLPKINMKSKYMMYSLSIIASLILLVQIIPIADAAGSQTRKDLEDQSIKNEQELNKLKSSLEVARKALKDAKDAADIEKENYQQNTADKKLLKIWEDAKVNEAQARLNYNKTLEIVRDFKPIKTSVKVEVAETDFANKQDLQEAKIPAPQKAPLTVAKEKLRDAKIAWKATLRDLIPAANNWKLEPTDDNLSALKQAIQVTQNAVEVIKDANDELDQLQNS